MICTPQQILFGRLDQENEMGGECGTYW